MWLSRSIPCGLLQRTIRFFGDDYRQVNLTDRADQAFLIQRRVVGAIQFLQLVIDIGEARAEPVQYGEVGLVKETLIYSSLSADFGTIC